MSYNDEFASLVERVFGDYPADDGESPAYLVIASGDEVTVEGMDGVDRNEADTKASNMLYDSLVDYTYGVSLAVAWIEKDSGMVYFPKVSNPYDGFDWRNGMLIGDLI
jgi:hypothetical protein